MIVLLQTIRPTYPRINQFNASPIIALRLQLGPHGRQLLVQILRSHALPVVFFKKRVRKHDKPDYSEMIENECYHGDNPTWLFLKVKHLLNRRRERLQSPQNEQDERDDKASTTIPKLAH